MRRVPITRLEEMKEFGNCTETNGQPCEKFHGIEQTLQDGSQVIVGHAVDKNSKDITVVDKLSYPTTLDTKADYIFITDFFTPGRYKTDFQLLLDNSEHWVDISELANPEDGITDKKHKVATRLNQETMKEKYYQQVKQINPDCKLFKLGFTIEEVDSVIKKAEN